MHKAKFERPKMRGATVVMLGTMFWGTSLCAAQGTQDAQAPATNSPSTLTEQAAGPATVSFIAQLPPTVSFVGQQTPPTISVVAQSPWWVEEGRACEGCPPRSVGRALFQTTIVNVLYGVANLARGQVTAEVTPKTWWANMEQGWVWDLDDFAVNQIGHPYQGNNYFNTGRANGLSFMSQPP